MLFKKEEEALVKIRQCSVTLLYKKPMSASSAAWSTSASSKIMRGDFPPSSSETGFKLLIAAAFIISRPTSVEPVKLTYIYTIKAILALAL